MTDFCTTCGNLYPRDQDRETSTNLSAYHTTQNSVTSGVPVYDNRATGLLSSNQYFSELIDYNVRDMYSHVYDEAPAGFTRCEEHTQRPSDQISEIALDMTRLTMGSPSRNTSLACCSPRFAGFSDCPLELRKMIYARCVPRIHVNIGRVERSKSALDGFLKVYPGYETEWNDFWYEHCNFLLDVRTGDAGARSRGDTSPGALHNRYPHSQAIAAWIRWLDRLKKRDAALIRNLHIYTALFSAKLHVLVRDGHHIVELGIIFRTSRTPFNLSQKTEEQVNSLVEDLRKAVSLGSSRRNCAGLITRDWDTLAKQTLTLVPLLACTSPPKLPNHLTEASYCEWCGGFQNYLNKFDSYWYS